jgi:hypothetical protein
VSAHLEAALRGLLLRVAPGPGGSAIVIRGIPVACSRGWPRIARRYRYELEIRDRRGRLRWSRAFQQHDVFTAAHLGHGELGVIVRQIDTGLLSLLRYAPREWQSATP